jgi:hypothetical protein
MGSALGDALGSVLGEALGVELGPLGAELGGWGAALGIASVENSALRELKYTRRHSVQRLGRETGVRH